jgi:hypothetical protein
VRPTGLALALPLAVGLAASGCRGGVTTLEPRETGSNTNGGETRRDATPPDDESIRTVPAYGAAPLPPPEEPPPEEREEDPRQVAAYGGPSMPMGPSVTPPPSE